MTIVDKRGVGGAQHEDEKGAGGDYEMESNMDPISPGDQGPGWKFDSA